MSGYLHFAREDEDSPAGRILQVIHRAGNAFHSTEFWGDTSDWTPVSYRDQIEEIVCRECDALTAERDELQKRVTRQEAAIQMWEAVGKESLQLKAERDELRKQVEALSQPMRLMPIGWNGRGEPVQYSVIRRIEACRGTLSECEEAMDRSENKEQDNE